MDARCEYPAGRSTPGDGGPWVFRSLLARSPGALRNGAPFKDWDLPSAIRRMQRKLGKVLNGGRPPLGTFLRNALPGSGESSSSA